MSFHPACEKQYNFCSNMKLFYLFSYSLSLSVSFLHKPFSSFFWGLVVLECITLDKAVGGNDALLDKAEDHSTDGPKPLISPIKWVKERFASLGPAHAPAQGSLFATSIVI